MDYLKYAELMSTALTVGQMALFVGCPTAGVTYLVARIAITQGAKLVAKRLMIATVAGATATAAAALMQGGGEGSGSELLPGYTSAEKTLESTELVISLDSDNQPQVQWGSRRLEPDEIKGLLQPLMQHGQLTSLTIINQLPLEGYGDWFLLLSEIRQDLLTVKSSAEIIIKREVDLE